MKNSQQKSPGRSNVRYSAADKLRVVKLYLEEGYQAKDIAQQFHIGKSSLVAWVRQYKESGVEAFTGSSPVSQFPNSDPAKAILTEQILEHKAAHPEHGALRIKQIFRRLLGLPVTIHQVRYTLENHPAALPVSPKKARREPAPIRFFERNSPNELWHTDVMYFIMPNREKVFVIGYLDDYSRFVVGMDIFHRQTIANTLDLLKKSCGDYTFPKEILTDGGRQFVSWTGNNQFGTYLRNHEIKHTVCRAHHPQTNGKMERFWRTLRMEFFDKAKISTFDELREQLQLYVKHYNFQRPHQGIGGMMPADRFFEIETEVKKQMVQCIAENTLELALKGTIKKPFFMVGRVGDSNVAIMEQKGRISMQIDGVPQVAGDPMTFDLTEKNSTQQFDKQETMEDINHGNNEHNTCGSIGDTDEERQSGIDGQGKMSGDSFGLDGENVDQRDLPEVFDATASGGTLGGFGAGGNAAGIGGASKGAPCGGCAADGVIKPVGETPGAQVQSAAESAENEERAGRETGAGREKGSAGTAAENSSPWRVNGNFDDFSITI